MKIEDVKIGSRVIAKDNGQTNIGSLKSDRAMIQGETGIVTDIKDRTVKIIADLDGKTILRLCDYIDLVPETINNTYQIY